MCSAAALHVLDILILAGFVIGRWWTLLAGPAVWLGVVWSCGWLRAESSTWGHAWLAARYVAIGLVTRYLLRVFARPVARLPLIVVFLAGALGFQLALHTWVVLTVDPRQLDGFWPVGQIGGFAGALCGWLAALVARRALSRRPELGLRIAAAAGVYLALMAIVLSAVHAWRVGDGSSLGLALMVVVLGIPSTILAPFLIPLWVGKSLADLAAIAAVGAVAVAPLLLLLFGASLTGSGESRRIAADPTIP